MTDMKEIYNAGSRHKLQNTPYLMEQLAARGHLKIDEFADLRDFRDFTNQLGLQYRPYQGAGIEREGALGDTTLLNVNLPDDFGGSTLHGEQYYLAEPPSVIFFYCNHKAAAGGETLLCKGTTLLKALPAGLKNKFVNQAITYKRAFSEEQWSKMTTTNPGFTKNWKIGARSGSQIITEFQTSAVWPAPNGELALINSILPLLFDFGDASKETIQITFNDGTVLDQEAGELILKSASTVQEEVLLKEGEGLAVDNSWVLHGRKPFVGKREMYTRMSLNSAHLSL